MKKNLMKKAHEMTRGMVEKYGDVDYRTQLGLCLSFLAQEGEQEMKIEGKSEKQIKYAKDCREKRIAQFERKIERQSKKSESEKTTYKVRKTDENLELTKAEAMQIGINILQNMTKAWEIINACECDIEILIYHYGQYR
jgi:hypothetical protein|nr:MAG TPA: hypothetical protein [Caudoviricetes sp.]